MKNANHKIPLYKIAFCVILLILIFCRIKLENDINIYIVLVNYAGMVVSFGSIWFDLLGKTKKNRKRELYVGILCIIFITFVAFGFCVLLLNIQFTNVTNDVVTLLALMFCISDTVFERFLKWIFRLSYIDE